MSYLYLFFSVIFNATGAITGKYFNEKNAGKKDTSPFFNLVQSVSVFVTWGIVFLCQFSFSAEVLPYSVAFALFYTLWMIGLINALKIGPASITTLMITMSLMVTTVWGFFFWGASLTPWVVVGLAFVVASMVLCLYSGKEKDKKFSWKWFAFVMLSFVSNATCSILQRTQQIVFDGQYGGQFMCCATLVSFVVCLVMYLRSDRTDSRELLKTSPLPIAAGVSNALCNLCFIVLATSELSPGLIYPVNGVGGLVVVVLASCVLFKEKLNARQIVGIVLGIAATALLSL